MNESEQKPGAWPPPAIIAALRDHGYDLEQASDTTRRSAIARRDLGDRVILLAIDGGGRFRIEATWSVEERSARDELATVPVWVVGSVTRTLTITGELDDLAILPEVLSSLHDMLGWGGTASRDPETSTKQISRSLLTDA